MKLIAVSYEQRRKAEGRENRNQDLGFLETVYYSMLHAHARSLNYVLKNSSGGI